MIKVPTCIEAPLVVVSAFSLVYYGKVLIDEALAERKGKTK